jgi:hypothetical protein
MAPRKKPTALAQDKSPRQFRARVRMYRQGLGDCFLVTLPRSKGDPFQLLIDCGALARDARQMQKLVSDIRDHVREEQRAAGSKARLDAVVGTHEHRDHLSGFNQARQIFNNDFDFKSVWMAWTENLGEAEIKKIKETRRKNIKQVNDILKSPRAASLASAESGVASLMSFSEDDDGVEGKSVADAFEYLKQRGRAAGDLRYLKPGGEPFRLDGVEGVLVYVLGPPLDPVLLKTSAVTEQMKQDDVVYHLSGAGEDDANALAAAAVAAVGDDEEWKEIGPKIEKAHPFAVEHRIFRPKCPGQPEQPQWLQPIVDFKTIKSFVDATYDHPDMAWRRIDDDWTSAVGQLALALDNDTNNTSLVLAFEFEKTGEVLLFPADAQVGSWRSWEDLKFECKVDGGTKQMPAQDLLKRTIFYKVGHHCSHNATLKKGGLELMSRDDLVAFIPLDIATAQNQGAKGWQMPAPPLHQALKEKTKNRVVISDVNEKLSEEAERAGMLATESYVDFYLK